MGYCSAFETEGRHVDIIVRTACQAFQVAHVKLFKPLQLYPRQKPIDSMSSVHHSKKRGGPGRAKVVAWDAQLP